MTQRPATYLLRGGLDTETPAIALAPGAVISGENYEPVAKGYRRVDGYERLDGRLSPSAAAHWMLLFDEGDTAFAIGDVVNGATSGATGVVLLDPVVQSGSYGTADAEGYLVLWKVAGEFLDNEQLRLGVDVRARADGTALRGMAPDDVLATTWRDAAVTAARAAIQKPAGEGPVRGVWVYNGDRYAVRDNVGATAAALFKSTPSGWQTVNLGHHILFGSGTTEPAEGVTINGLTSGATARVRRVARRTGAWSGSAAGLIAIDTITGAFLFGETLRVGSSDFAIAASAAVPNALPPGGRYDFDNYNFLGSAGTTRMYAAGGVGPAWEWDGAVFVPIFTGMADDRPIRVRGHRFHLWLGFRGGSMQAGGTGDPYAWTPVLGASEIGLGDEITGISAEDTSTLTVFSVSRIALLYGSSSDDWELRPFSRESGARPWTAQRIGTLTFVDDSGVRTLATSDRYGDFSLGTMTEMIRSALSARKDSGAVPVASLRSRSKAQYRVFYDDGIALYIYFGRKRPEPMFMRLPISISCSCSGEDLAGQDILLVGTADGWVMQMDRGTSFDGQQIDAFMRLPFATVGQPNRNKRWHGVTLELEGGDRTALSVQTEFSYGDLVVGSPAGAGEFTVRGGGGFWSEANWDQFYWSSAVKGRAWAPIDGFGESLSIVVVSRATTEEPHTLQALTFNFSYRGQVRI